ncbi:MAG: YdeI/OmpD-associated family protein [Nocardioides sp.]
MADDLPELLVEDAAAWRVWLLEHHDSARGVWLVLHKKGGAVTTLDYEQAVCEALCFGWIDGQGKRRDEASSLQRMTPRGSRSRWSQTNVARVGRLEEAGLMHESGRAAVRAAKADGRWEEAYAGPATAVAPDDLAEAIAANPDAEAMFEVLTSTNRFALIHRLGAVKRQETRDRKIREFVEMLARHETPYPQKRRPADR